ncbi:MAG: 1-(5-phosphoribosyl)-5-((5-phosphoribosylamino)methylideneamino)imidazole-4-carboxamide isomerase [Alphaproteobacteria bacterium]|nr:1-(5-phosphoribosyl)-5-((5-phosphoribosylamino)methylideneamino)imidazole-4-carboxamide isomerase [Alphaproteobacteria bacterium]MBV8549363.1 1-(5-phosphoribosyl)-5-((5-phosphoribosylamino)methylideneamino)imidazole-4-carboxamide isomerase [Alphaproteobacteria bacterium]
MILYPSIHLKDNKVARLTRAGDLQAADILHDDPAARAAAFAAQGFEWLHVVDLDGAFVGQPVNAQSITDILHNVKMPMQLSGGMRSMKHIEEWIEKGVARIVLTSAALQNPDLVREACRAFPGRIAVKIDSTAGYVTRTGWSNTTRMKALDLALQVEEAGVSTLIYADINNGGALSEINLEAIIDLAFALTMPVVASGGVHSMHDLEELKENARAGIAGLILGRALYDGILKAEEALKLAKAG